MKKYTVYHKEIIVAGDVCDTTELLKKAMENQMLFHGSFAAYIKNTSGDFEIHNRYSQGTKTLYEYSIKRKSVDVNATVELEGTEYFDADLLYKVYFVIDSSSNRLSFIGNRSAEKFQIILPLWLSKPITSNVTLSGFLNVPPKEAINSSKSIDAIELIKGKQKIWNQSLDNELDFLMDYHSASIVVKVNKDMINRETLASKIHTPYGNDTVVHITNQYGIELAIQLKQEFCEQKTQLELGIDDLRNHEILLKKMSIAMDEINP